MVNHYDFLNNKQKQTYLRNHITNGSNQVGGNEMILRIPKECAACSLDSSISLGKRSRSVLQCPESSMKKQRYFVVENNNIDLPKRGFWILNFWISKFSTHSIWILCRFNLPHIKFKVILKLYLEIIMKINTNW